MKQRNKRQHFIPRFYLSYFCDADGKIWTHDSRRGEALANTPDNTAIMTDMYSPTLANGEHFDEIDKMLDKIEDAAAPLMLRLLSCDPLDVDQKATFAIFLASLFVRSPAHIRQRAALFGDIAAWGASHQLEHQRNTKKKLGQDTRVEENLLRYMNKRDGLELNVDRQVGLAGFRMLDPISRIIERMTWSFELSKDENLVTSDNPVFWVPSHKMPKSPYGFGLTNKFAVIPFPLSPWLMLRIDHESSESWDLFSMTKARAKHSNQLQAQHKDHCLYYRTHHKGLHLLGMKYKKPVQQLDSGVSGPKVNVARKLKS
ncbi:MAG: DUF4238 domain-containing protein [Rhizobiaceae bacterium]